jgi:hypothetical protein
MRGGLLQERSEECHAGFLSATPVTRNNLPLLGNNPALFANNPPLSEIKGRLMCIGE